MNHTEVDCNLIEVYQNQTNSFKLSRHDTIMRWRILLGGWGGTRSRIEEWPLDDPDKLCTKKHHSRNDFNTLKKNFQVTVADKSITIKNHENGEIFLRCSDERITKSYLTHMSASSGKWQVSGNLQIEKIKGLFKFVQKY